MRLRYSQQYVTVDDERAVLEALRSPNLTQGLCVERFEEELAEYVGARYAVAVNSGTAALHLAVAAITKVGPVQTSALSFVATANAVQHAGFRVKFLDVDRKTGNVVEWDRDLTNGGTVRIPVHFAGRPAVLSQWHLPIIEDACHALGAWDFDACSMVGSCKHSLATCFSFHPVKPITTAEGGAVTTNNEGLRDVMREMRSHGRNADGLMVRMGWNYRMDELSAALGSSQLSRCGWMRDRRAELAMEYDRLLQELPVTLNPHTIDQRGMRDSFHLYTMRVHHSLRDRLKKHLNEVGIGAQVHYNPIIPQHPYYAARHKYDPAMLKFPEAEAWAAEELSLPLHAAMVEADVKLVVDEVRWFFEKETMR